MSTTTKLLDKLTTTITQDTASVNRNKMQRKKTQNKAVLANRPSNANIVNIEMLVKCQNSISILIYTDKQ